MTKHEIYETLKADGAKLQKAERFMSLADLKEMYEERFGIGCRIEAQEITVPANTSGDGDKKVRLLRFDESGWCPALCRSYSRGLYRPKNLSEYEALKPFAAEVV